MVPIGAHWQQIHRLARILRKIYVLIFCQSLLFAAGLRPTPAQATAISWILKDGMQLMGKLICRNAGISSSGNATCIPNLDIYDSSVVISFCGKWSVGLVVVRPEAPLVSGLANDLVKAGIPTFGPST
ncbi:hypothetical protein REPUB_Repub01dG0056400 [Reevesia pubescens]